MPKKPNGENAVTRDQFQKGMANLAGRFLALENDVRGVKETMLTKKDGDKIMNRLDSIVGWIETSQRKEPVQDHRLANLEAGSKDHESRISRLESSALK